LVMAIPPLVPTHRSWFAGIVLLFGHGRPATKAAP
jgi:hypothetical protein